MSPRKWTRWWDIGPADDPMVPHNGCLPAPDVPGNDQGRHMIGITIIILLIIRLSGLLILYLTLFLFSTILR
jgi:hypothetical protein